MRIQKDYPYHIPVRRSSATTIQRVSTSLPSIPDGNGFWGVYPIAVAIGPYHHHELLQVTKPAKRAALEELCRVANQSPEAIRHKITSVAASASRCYASDWSMKADDGSWQWHTYDGDEDGGGGDGTANDGGGGGSDDGTVNDGIIDDRARFVEIMLLDGCFLLQFMVSMCPDDPNAPPDPLMSRPEVHTCIDAIVRDVMLLENQIPWMVLEALMELRPGVPVEKFLALMASAFDGANNYENETAAVVVDVVQLGGAEPTRNDGDGDGNDGDQPLPPPHHLLGLFHRRQVGAARTQTLCVPRLSSLCTTAVELAEMGVKLSASKTKKFGDMTMSKWQWRRGLFGELSLAPVVLTDRTTCWLTNMAAYEACLGATRADNFAVSSYVSVVAQLVNREEDVRELRGKGIINSAMSDTMIMVFFKSVAPHLRVGHRYYEVFQGLEEYRQERWVWIAIHRFLYKNYKTMAAVLSIIGVLAGLFKTILSLKQPQS